MFIFIILSFILLCVGENESKMRKKRLFGGEFIDIKDAPSYVWLTIYKSNSPDTHCGGNILDAYHVSTAARCLYGTDVKEIMVKYATTNLDTANKLYTKTFYIHPEYNTCKNECRTLKYQDIGMVVLDEPIPLNANAQAIDLPKEPMSSNDIEGLKDCSVAGWGATGPNSTKPSNLKLIHVTVNQTACEVDPARYRYDFSVHICVDNKKGDICQGDFGDGLICNNVLYGVASFGPFYCGSGAVPATFARVDAALDFINNIMKETNKSVVKSINESSRIKENLNKTSNQAESTKLGSGCLLLIILTISSLSLKLLDQSSL